MPEGPECKLTTNYLQEKLGDKILTEVTILSGKYKDKNPVGYQEFVQFLPFNIVEIGCKGKLIYFVCHTEERTFYILNSLRMTGRWQNYQDEYCRWVFKCSDGTECWFRNPRSFATIDFVSEEDWQTKLNGLGPDIMTDEFSLDIWRHLLTKYKRKNITSLLMDQSIMAGCGNYIKAEVLYRARVSPHRKAGSLDENESKLIYQALKDVTDIAYNQKGVSIRDYTNADGDKGEYQNFLQIYGQPHAKKEKTPDGRVTHWDPSVQN